MIRPVLLSAASAAALCGCTTVQPIAADASSMGPTAAILRAADAAPRAVPGDFVMHVAATGRQDGRIYLNSERDYRDQRNLTVAIEPQAIPLLERKFGASPDAYFRGKWIEVRGAAQRVRIDFIAGGRPTSKYYYQTHVRVADPSQIVSVRSY